MQEGVKLRAMVTVTRDEALITMDNLGSARNQRNLADKCAREDNRSIFECLLRPRQTSLKFRGVATPLAGVLDPIDPIHRVYHNSNIVNPDVRSTFL